MQCSIHSARHPPCLVGLGHRNNRHRLRAPISWQSKNCSELNVDNWNDNCEAKSEAKSPRPLRGLQVDFSLTRNVSYAVR